MDEQIQLLDTKPQVIDPTEHAFRWVWANSPKRSQRTPKGHKGETEKNFRLAVKKHGLQDCITAFRNYLEVVMGGQLPKDSERWWKKEYEKYIDIEDGPVAVIGKPDARQAGYDAMAAWAIEGDRAAGL